MGWKAFKEKFEINHNVTINNGRLCIGSFLSHDLVNFCVETGIWQTKAHPEFLRENYPALLSTPPSELVRIIAEKDEFEVSIPIYLFEDGEIVKTYCEAPEHGKPTHSGEMLEGGHFWLTEEKAVEIAKKRLIRDRSHYEEYAQTKEKELESAKARLIKNNLFLKNLNLKYPNITTELE